MGSVSGAGPLDRRGGRWGIAAPWPPPEVTVAVATALGVGAVAAIVVPLSTNVLRYPGWFAAQRVALILGAPLVGVYWQRRRPGSRFGWLLIILGLLGFRSAWRRPVRRGRG